MEEPQNILFSISMSHSWRPPSPHFFGMSHSIPCHEAGSSAAMVWSQGGADYTASPFPEHNVLEALLYLLLTRVIWSSHADLSGRIFFLDEV